MVNDIAEPKNQRERPAEVFPLQNGISSGTWKTESPRVHCTGEQSISFFHFRRERLKGKKKKATQCPVGPTKNFITPNVGSMSKAVLLASWDMVIASIVEEELDETNCDTTGADEDNLILILFQYRVFTHRNDILKFNSFSFKIGNCVFFSYHMYLSFVTKLGKSC